MSGIETLWRQNIYRKILLKLTKFLNPSYSVVFENSRSVVRGVNPLPLLYGKRANKKLLLTCFTSTILPNYFTLSGACLIILAHMTTTWEQCCFPNDLLTVSKDGCV